MEITVTSSEVRFSIDGQLAEVELRPNNFTFDSIVLGSDLTANGHDAFIDNVKVTRLAAVAANLVSPTVTQNSIDTPLSISDAANSPASLFLNPIAPATQFVAQPAAADSLANTTPTDELLLLTLAQLPDNPTSEPNDMPLRDDSPDSDSALPTLELAFSEWK